jgi:hypothetical protein
VTRTWRALRPSGGLNALTALETASMPVSDEPPLANAFSSVKIITEADQPSSAVPMCRCVPRVAFCCGRLPSTSRISPTTIIRMTEPENR